MSNSRNKTPIIGYTTATSDKPGKKQAFRRFRRKTKVELQQGKELFTIHTKQTTAWDMPKDGKHYVKDIDIKFLRK
ncbi:hypothetical protein [Parasediminibacterium sp. JCM 36343]|uniref:hypothetical protein n=1 Tax=Parasediminibacterium sp. JCM 36343 TaxID=3374279 RepID=UPI00397A0D6B